MVIVGDCRERLREMADGSVQTCVTSPPYFGLRDYGVSGQIGLEASLDQYVADLVAVFREVRRVLHDTGTLWLNLGDTYASAWPCNRRNVVGSGSLENGKRENRPPRLPDGLKEKDLIGVPWRVAFALQADGWYLRSDIVWHKPNPMPESVRDRPTKAHEYLFLLTKQPRYFYDAEAIKEPCTPETVRTGRYRMSLDGVKGVDASRGDAATLDRFAPEDGRNKRTVWTITPKPFKGAHFAVMPPALVEPCILAGTSERGQCPACGAPWRRVVERESAPAEVFANRLAPTDELTYSGSRVNGTMRGQGQKLQDWRDVHPPRTTGWQPSCTCNAGEPIPQTVLDPFAGSGTVGVVALSHGRRFVGVELNESYAAMAEARIAREVRPRMLTLPLTEALEGAAD